MKTSTLGSRFEHDADDGGMTEQGNGELLRFIAATVEFMRDPMAMKDDLAELRERMATKDDLIELRPKLRRFTRKWRVSKPAWTPGWWPFGETLSA